MLNEGSDMQAAAIVQRVSPALFPAEIKVKRRVKWRRRDEAMNEMARAFLSPPSAPHLAAARNDFAEVVRMPLGQVTGYLFETTASLYCLFSEIPELPHLVTFRNYTPERHREIAVEHRYFRFWEKLSLNWCLTTWLVGFTALFVLDRRRRIQSQNVCFYGLALALVGVAMVASTCLLGGILPRYALPTWELVWIAMLIYAGAISDALRTRQLQPANP